MAKGLTDAQVEQQIARLQQSPHVKLANQERRLRERRRMYLYSLRQQEKKGKGAGSCRYHTGGAEKHVRLGAGVCLRGIGGLLWII